MVATKLLTSIAVATALVGSAAANLLVSDRSRVSDYDEPGCIVVAPAADRISADAVKRLSQRALCP